MKLVRFRVIMDVGHYSEKRADFPELCYFRNAMCFKDPGRFR